MSLFDAIRYPISNKPTVEELQRVPQQIIQQWRDHTVWKQHSTISIEGVSAWYARPRSALLTPEVIVAMNVDKMEIDFLRRLIAKWDDYESI
jgi:hypothetical protein